MPTSFFEKVFFVETMSYLANTHILEYTDKTSMAVSLEVTGTIIRS